MNNFDKNWKTAKTSIFRLEGRLEYKVAGETAKNAKSRLCEPNIMSNDKDWQKWLVAVANAKKEGIKVQRVRVIPEPVSDYIRREIEIWQKHSQENSEELFSINTADYNNIIAESRFSLKDFWLFDDEKLVILNYNTAGLLIDHILIDNGRLVRIYCELKRKILKKAVPMEIFTKK